MLVCLGLVSCGVYSFTGASIPVNVKTFSIQNFDNRAEIVNPNLASMLTEKLTARILTTTSLTLQRDRGDINFEGFVSGYVISLPTITSSGQQAGGTEQNRLTITIQVTYTDTQEPKNSFSKSLSQFYDFPSTKDLSMVEREAHEELSKKLVDDIYREAFERW